MLRKKEKCSICNDNYYYIENSKTKECFNQTNLPKGYYFNKEKNLFSACHKNCDCCSIGPISDDGMNCDTCKNGFKYDKKNKNCKKKGNVFLAVFLTIIIILLLVAIGIVVFIIYKKKKAVDDNTPNL